MSKMIQGVSKIFSNGQTNNTPAHSEEFRGETAKGKKVSGDLAGGVGSAIVHAQDLCGHG